MRFKLPKPEDFEESDKGYAFQVIDAYHKTYSAFMETLIYIDGINNAIRGEEYEKEWALEKLDELVQKYKES